MVSIRGINLADMVYEFQTWLDDLSLKMANIVFNFSASKTVKRRFSKSTLANNPPTLKLAKLLYHILLCMFLGLTWDSKLLQWNRNVTILKAECKKLIGILKSIISHSWGADQTVTVEIYRTCIRSKLDYGSSVHSSENHSFPVSWNSLVMK